MGERRSHDEPYKRFACDRCHALKLRCMRKVGPDAEGETCVRCHRASALCRYSPSERLGRPPDKSRLKNPPNSRIPSQKRRRCEVNSTMEWMASSPSVLDRSIPAISLWGEPSTQAARWTAKDDPDETIESRPNPLPGQEVGCPLIDTQSHTVDLGRNGETNQDMFSFENGRDLFESSTRGSSADFELDDTSLEFLAEDCFADTVRGHGGKTSQGYSLGTSTIFQETATVPDKELCHATQDPASPNLSEPAVMTTTNGDYAETMQCFRSTSSEAKEECMRRLSDIIIILFQQLKAISSSSSMKVSSPSPEAAPRDSLAAYHLSKNTTSIGDIFRISEDLIQILESFEPISGCDGRSPIAVSRSPSVGVLPSATSNARPISPVSLSSHDSRSLRGRHDSNSLSPACSSSHPTFSNGSTSSIALAHSVRYLNETARAGPSLSPNNCFPIEPRNSLPKMKPSAEPLLHFKSSKLIQLDIPTMLLIVTCYNLLTRIYNIFFTRWLQILAKYPSAADRELLPEILPCFELGGFKPPNYGSLQMSIIIEASMHLIRKIEEYLDRPDRNQEGGTRPKGPVLQLMDLVMEDGESPVQLRENVEAIKRLIKS